MNNKKGFLLGLGTGIMIMIVAVFGYSLYSRHVRWGGGLSPNQKVNQIYSIVSRHAIMDFDRSQMIENMYRGFLAGMEDPYSQYLCLEALEVFRVRTEGTSFVGIGVRVTIDPADRTLTLINVFRNAPASDAGLLPGDKILTVDGVDVVGRSMPEILALITGPAGTSVNIEIFRPHEGQRFKVDVMRAQITVPTVFHEMLETEGRRTGYIRIEAFERPTYGQFSAAIAELLDYGMDSLIIDVRNNPGGLLDTVVSMTNMLVPEGIITYRENAQGEREIYSSTGDYLGLPLVVLVNERSASASEVMAGAVLDTGVGTLVGTQTFGKGTVQGIFGISDNTAVKLTIAKYFTPSGFSLHGIGLTPGFEVEMEESLSRRIGDLPIEEDVQLQVGLRVVLSK